MDFGAALRDRRRRARLSQLELATGAATTQRHVSFLESGRSVPGRAVVLRLAESLRLSLRERNALLAAAGFAPAHPETPVDHDALAAVRTVLQHVLDGHEPYPAIVVGRHGVLVATNAAFAALVDGVAPELTGPGANAYRLALHPRGLAPRIRNLPRWGRHVLDRLDDELARRPDDTLAALRAELRGHLPTTPDPPDGAGFAVPLRLETDRGELRLVTTVTTFATATDVSVAELKLEAFLPPMGRRPTCSTRGVGRPTERPRHRVFLGSSKEVAVGMADKFDNKVRELRGRVKRNTGEVTGDPALEAEGRSEETGAHLRQTGERIKDVFRGRGRRRH